MILLGFLCVPFVKLILSRRNKFSKPLPNDDTGLEEWASAVDMGELQQNEDDDADDLSPAGGKKKSSTKSPRKASRKGGASKVRSRDASMADDGEKEGLRVSY